MDIHTYASEGNVAGVRSELAKGVPVDAKDERGRTALDYAASSPAAGVEMLQLLIGAGTDVNMPVEEEKRLPIASAACLGSLEKVQLLLDAGGDINFVSPGGYTILINIMYKLHDDERLVPMIQFLVSKGATTDGETQYGESPLSVASHFGRFDAVEALLKAGAEPTPLQWTDLMKAVVWGTCDDLERAIDHGGLHDRDRWERTPWLLAAVIGDIEKAKLLLSAGASLGDQARGGDTALMICAARGYIGMAAWLIEIGNDIETVDGAGNTALMLAAQAGRADSVELLLQAGAQPSPKNDYNENAIEMSSNEQVLRLLLDAGEDIADISTEMKRTLVGLDGSESINVSKADYESGCRARFGRSNPELMDIPFWHDMIRAGISAYQAKSQFGDEDNMSEATWCFDRFGMSFTELPDGRYVQIGGEHEDFYDPDFCIYNDVVIHQRSGEFQIMGYPEEVFPPTDFHSATFFDGFIYIIGRLGYHGSRQFETTPIYRLNCTTWKIEAVESTGDNPGWIYEHKARIVEPGVLEVSGGKICKEIDGEEEHPANKDLYALNLSDLIWARR